MGSDSQKVKLSDIASINPRRKVKKGNVVPFFEMAALPLSGRSVSRSDIQERVAKAAGSHFRDGDTLLARITPCLENGKTAQVQGLGDGVIGEGSTEFIVLCGQDGADNDFIYYLCRSPDFRDFAIARMEGTSGRQRVAWKSIADYQLILPAPEIRREAASLLAKLDDRIDNLRQTNATLEAIAQALFKSWFVDFDPVHAKAEGREPEGMDAATAALFPSEFEDSELGPIPKGWRRVSFGDVATLSKGSVNPMATPAQEFLHYSLPAFDAGQLPLTELGESIKSNKTPVPPDAVLVSKLNPHIPRIWFVGDAGPHAVCSTEFLVWTPKPGVGSAFIYTLAASMAFNSAMRQLVTGTSNSHQRVKPDQLAEVQAATISDAVLAQFDAIAAPMLQQVVHNRRRAAALAEARDTLLPRLISGKLRLPEAETITESTIQKELEIP